MVTRDVACRHGVFRQIEDDIWVSRSLRELGEYSEDELQFITTLLDIVRRYKPGPIEIVEAGAYIGDLTVPLSRAADKIYAFEPQDEIREILQYNLDQNGCKNVVVYPYALGDVEKTIYFDPAQNPESPGSKMMGAPTGIPVKMVTLDSLELSPCLIKADVEGMELALLAGAQQTIARSEPIFFCECDTVLQQEGEPTLEDAYRYFNYSMKKMIFPVFRPDNFNQTLVNTFGSTASFMLLGIPQCQN